MGILDEINKVIDKEKIGSSKEYIPAYSTGIDVLDYGNASFNPDTNSVDVGLMAGTLTMFIGPSGSGKTTAALEIAGNIVRGFDNTTIIHADFERATSSNRAKTILNLSDEEFKEKYTKLNSGISSESVYKLCKAVAQVKKDKYEEIKYDTGHKDDKGDTIYELPPTIIIVDSVAAMFPENTNDEEELGGQMSATAAAKVNNQIIKRLIGSSTLEQGNIMIFAINHITTKVDINPMAKTPAALNFLKPDESLPGGTSFPFLSNVLIKFTPRDKYDPESKSSTGNRFNIKGFLSELTLIKSRSAEAGKKIEIVYSQVEGFLNGLSNFKFLADENYLSGSNRAYFIPEDPDTKFTAKKFHEIYSDPSNAEFREKFDKFAREKLINKVPRRAIDKVKYNEEGLRLDLLDASQDIWKGSDGKYYDSSFEEIEVVSD